MLDVWLAVRKERRTGGRDWAGVGAFEDSGSGIGHGCGKELISIMNIESILI
jgi:hypothetical protein